MRYLIVLEPIKDGFAVQVPDLAIATYGKDADEARHAAVLAIKANIQAYYENDKDVPEKKPVDVHLKNPDFRELFFGFVDVNLSEVSAAA